VPEAIASRRGASGGLPRASASQLSQQSCLDGDGKMLESATRRFSVAAYERGDYVKVEFRDESTGESEWMWVKVDYCDDVNRLVFGWLNNGPVVHAEKLKVGQHLAISYDKIKEHRSPTNT